MNDQDFASMMSTMNRMLALLEAQQVQLTQVPTAAQDGPPPITYQEWCETAPKGMLPWQMNAIARKVRAPGDESVTESIFAFIARINGRDLGTLSWSEWTDEETGEQIARLFWREPGTEKGDKRRIASAYVLDSLLAGKVPAPKKTDAADAAIGLA